MTRVCLLLAVALAACGGDDGGATADAAGPDAPFSVCGHPGDTGNSLGVGKYCESFADCSGNAEAVICSVIGDTTTHFCTKTCNDTDAGPTDPDAGALGQCGEMASCQCQGGQCGCTPDSCLGP